MEDKIVRLALMTDGNVRIFYDGIFYVRVESRASPSLLLLLVADESLDTALDIALVKATAALDAEIDQHTRAFAAEHATLLARRSQA